MISETLTEYFIRGIGSRKVTHALFTTYNFEPDFFETEIIPLLFSEERYYSNHPTIKRVQVKQELDRSKINIELFYDQNIFNSDETPQMEYLHQSINHLNGAFHPKIIYILMENSLLLYAGSHNLTKAGWWDNIETGNYILIDKKHGVNQVTYDNIEKSLEYLKHQQSFKLIENSAIVAIEEFLKEDVKIVNNSSISFYFQSNKTDNCEAFFEHQLSSKLTHLEIISPFFPDKDKSDLHIKVFPKDYSINIFLPKNQQDKAMCKEDYYKFCISSNLVWSKFIPEVEKNLEIKKDSDGNRPAYRKLHAKVFHFYNKQVSYFFTGSFNFTYKALYVNIEAGFLYKADQVQPSLLEELHGSEIFANDLHDEENPIVEGTDRIDIDILFDWESKELTVNLSSIEGLEKISLSDNNSNRLQEINIVNESTTISNITPELLTYMEKNSYIHFGSQSILMQHINWQYKPLSFGQMSISEILSIYSSLDITNKDERYIAYMLHKLDKEGALYESSINDVDVLARNFFSEYSEIFYSFRMLKKLLIEAKDNNKVEILEYYFRMEYPDSFSSVLKKIKEDDNLEITTKYIVLLSLEEIYDDIFKTIDKYENAYEFEKLAILKDAIKQNIGDTFPEQQNFLEWFEKEFKLVHKTKGNSND